MSVLTNRRDITAARNPQPQVEAPSRDELTELIDAVRENNSLTREQIEGHRSDINELCVTDREPAQAAMEDFPLPGAKRLIVRRTGNGGTYAVAATTPMLLVAANEARLGLLVTNQGAGGVTLILTADLLEPGGSQPLSGGSAQVWVPAGGSWNGQVGDLPWCGNVLAYASAAATLCVAEV